jgi:hypothetical protein
MKTNIEPDIPFVYVHERRTQLVYNQHEHVGLGVCHVGGLVCHVHQRIGCFFRHLVVKDLEHLRSFVRGARLSFLIIFNHLQQLVHSSVNDHILTRSTF